MTNALNRARIIGLLALCALLGACSAIKLAYNNFDEVAYWWLDGYVNFTEEQSPRVRADLDRLHLWHRQSELPRYAQMLQQMEDLAPSAITAAQACTFAQDIRGHLDVLLLRAEPPAVTLALGLDAEQLRHLERKYRKNIADYRKDWIALTPSAQKEKRYAQALERLEMIYGKLDGSQRAVLRRQIDQSVFDPLRILAERERRQRDTLQTLEKLAGNPVSLQDARALLHGLLERSLVPPEGAPRAFQDALLKEGCETLAATHNSTTQGQRDTAGRRLRAYQRDLRELAGQK